MALFKSSSGAPAVLPQEFSEYTEKFAKQPVLISCDMNFEKTLPNKEFCYCVKVQMEIHADPDSEELVTEGELAHVSNIRSIIGQHLKGRYVGQGIISSQNMVFFMIYVPQSMAKISKTMLEQTKNTTFRQMDYTIQYDPEGKQYLEFLYPNELQKKQMENRRILRSLRGYGDNGTAPRKIRFHVVFPNRQAALDFANAAKEKGFSYDSLTKEPAPEGMVLPRYQLALVRDLPFDIELLDLVDQYIMNLCEPYEGEFRSIETDVV